MGRKKRSLKSQSVRLSMAMEDNTIMTREINLQDMRRSFPACMTRSMTWASVNTAEEMITRSENLASTPVKTLSSTPTRMTTRRNQPKRAVDSSTSATGDGDLERDQTACFRTTVLSCAYFSC